MTSEQTASHPLPAADLRKRCDPASLPFASTEEIEALDHPVGQDRAMEAIRLAIESDYHDFNLFVLGESGMGRHQAVSNLLSLHARTMPIADDWAYVNDFDAPDRPKALCLPPGTAQKLKLAMQRLVDDLAIEIPSMFDSEEYQAQRRTLEEEFSERQESEMAAFADKAKEEDIAVVRTPTGFMLAPLRDGHVLKNEDFNQLEDEQKRQIGEKISRLQQGLATVLRNAPRLNRELRGKVEALHASMAERVVSARVAELADSFTSIQPVADYLAEVRDDMIANAELFVAARGETNNGAFPDAIRKYHQEPPFERYVVNVMVSRCTTSPEDCAPIVYEDMPNPDHLIGRIEHGSHMGTLVTNFTMIKPGALHRANGGFLVLDARRVFSEPYAWDALIRCLKNRSIAITSLAERLSLISTTSLQPDPIPLDVRVILIGDRRLYMLLTTLDPDFRDLFRIQADFEEEFDRSEENTIAMARLIAGQVRREGLLHLSAAATACVIDEAVRLAEDNSKLTLHFEHLADLAREADHYARAAGRTQIDATDIGQAVAARERRASRIRDRMQEMIGRKTILIDTEGRKTGQINGLSVSEMGNYRFGRPARITARTRMGAGKLVDIEREVELGGPLHSKGVLILSGYLLSTFALDVPFSLYASLVFEQSYGGIDGDSASSAELYAILSALADLPIDQGLAVTGSVNQLGEVQAIGGVNEKVEGFYDVCHRAGLTGNQGVLIPQANVDHLMLRPDVVEAAAEGRFRIIPVSSINQGIALLTGSAAGTRQADGAFPADSVNGRVESRLREYADQRRSFGARDGKGDHPNGGPDER